MRALDNDPSGSMGVLDAGTRKVIVTYPDEVLHEAAAKMLRNDIGRLPVADRRDQQRVVSYLGRPGIMAACLRGLDDEHLREPGGSDNLVVIVAEGISGLLETNSGGPFPRNLRGALWTRYSETRVPFRFCSSSSRVDICLGKSSLVSPLAPFRP